MKNFLDTYVCVNDGDIIWASSLIKFMFAGYSYKYWLPMVRQFDDRLKTTEGDSDKVHLILAFENL